MRFSEYLPRFEGDFSAEGRRLLGDHLDRFSQLQAAIFPSSPDADYLQDAEDFYRIFIGTGVYELFVGTDPHVPWLTEEISGRIEGPNVVDIGCCGGLFTVFYAMNHPDANFTGIDISEYAVEAARARASRYDLGNTRWLRGNVFSQEMKGEIHGASTVILQDTLCYLSQSWCPESEILYFLNPLQDTGSVAVIARAVLGKRPTDTMSGYACESHRIENIFDRRSGDVTYQVDVFRKKDGIACL